MKIHPAWFGWGLAVLVAGAALGAAIASISAAPVLLIPLLSLSIVTIAIISQGGSDILLYLVTGAAFLLPMNNVRLSATLTVGDGLIAIALVLIVVIRMSQRDLRLSGLDGLLIGLVMVVFGGLLGSFFATSTGASLAGLGRFGVATIALPVLFGLWQPRIPQLRIIGCSIVAGSTLSAVVGIVAIRLLGRAQGLTNHPNHLALASVMAVGVALGLALSAPRRSHFVLLLGAIALLTMGILSSGSRSGFIAEVLVVAVIAVITRDRRIILASATAAIIFAVMLVSGQLGRNGNSAVARLLGGGGVVASDQARAQTLRAALHVISLHPLTGQGFEGALATHDVILEVAATAGVFGLLGFGLVAWITVRPIWQRYRWGSARKTEPGDFLLVGAIAAVLGFVANGLFAPQLYDRYIWIVVTIAVALHHELTATTREPPHSARRAAYA